MSVNIGSQQLSLPVDLVAQQLSSTNKQSAQVDLQPNLQSNVPVNFDSQQLPLSGMHQGLATRQSPKPVNLKAYPLQSVPMEPHFNLQTPMSAYVGSQQLSPTTRRPSGVQPSLNVETSMSIKMGSQHSPSTNKRPSHMEASPKFRSTMLIDPVSQQMSANKRPHLEPPSKVPTESFESVRLKLRESLTSALGMFAQQQSKIQSVNKSSPIDTTNAQKQADSGAPSDEKNSITMNASSQETSSETLTSCEQYGNLIENSSDKTKTWECDLQEYQSMNIPSDDQLSFNNSSTSKDEFLQGHGLCWAPEADVDYSEAMQNHSAKKPKRSTKDIALLNAERLATEIEAELFKFFGGVNKKYKEKGRSLLFNLKDRSNPELRERVLSGDIAPDRLCSMTAEELASKELSEWRLAKAEEFAQMVVLQDSQVDIRRLVRKTHKGEFQVEVEHDDNISVEVDLAADVLSQVPRKPNEVQAHRKSKDRDLTSSKSSDSKALEGLQPAKGDSGDQNLLGDSDTQLHEQNELIQDFMVDELKETEFLPPIVSLDVFMEDLDKEPPFENLPMDNEQDISSAEKNSITLDPGMEPASDLESEMSPVPNRLVPRSDPAPEGSGSESDWQDMLVSKQDSFENIAENPANTSKCRISKMDEKYAMTGSNLKSGSVHEQQDTFLADVTSKSDYIWEGEIQLNISALATITGFFRSGERTSSQEWSGFIEIKGRVRLDAFEKFLQELPLSRSRAIMITHFFWKEGSPIVGRVNICEAVNSYVTDERVGFAEPAPGVEIYLCPPHPKTTEMLERHLPKEHTSGLQSVVDGLIGVVVWRRPVTVSHHKHKKHSSSRKHHDSAPKSSMPPNPTKNLEPPPENEPVDDIPPGFGPRDDDDLPEFDFVNGIKRITAPTHGHGLGPSMPQVPPVEQMRELIHKYGQINNARRAGLKIQPWNDDDDIPEWQPSQPIRPQIPTLPPPPPLQPQGYLQQSFVPNQSYLQQPMQALQATPQQFVPYGMPMQMPMQMQPQMGVVPGLPNVPPGWQTTPWLPPFNGVMQPSQGQYVGEGGQFPGVMQSQQNVMLQPQQNAMIWRPDNPRGFR